jgi:hypothetical protein
MRKPATFLPALALGIAGAISAATPSPASPITYTETATASGSLDGTPFSGATVVLTMNGNTSNIMGTPPSLTNIAPLTVMVGGTTATFSDQTLAEVFQSTTSVSPNAGFGDNTQALAILLTMNASFNSYGLDAPIDLSGPAVFNAGSSFPTTTEGNFILNSVSGNVTFTETPLPAVPEPVSLVLLVVGLASLGLIEYRRKP